MNSYDYLRQKPHGAAERRREDMREENGLKKIAQMLQTAREHKASDVHLAVGHPMMFRIDGALVQMPGGKTEPDEMEMLTELLVGASQKEALERSGETEFSCAVADGGRIRVNVFRERGAYAMTLRLLPQEIPTPESLGVPKSLVELTRKRNGLVLVTGGAGSGKSATLASLVGAIAENEAKKVITLERPIEYLYPQGRGMVLQREIGRDGAGYAKALQAALKQDSDVILVGELRDAETIALAVEAAESGHLVFAALHMEGAAAAVEYITGSFPPDLQEQMRTRFAGVLEGIAAQQLLPVQNGGGRIAAFEVLSVNRTVRELIREGRFLRFAPIPQSVRKEGMQTMDDAIYELYMRSYISSETAVSYAYVPEEMRQKVQIF